MIDTQRITSSPAKGSPTAQLRLPPSLAAGGTALIYFLIVSGSRIAAELWSCQLEYTTICPLHAGLQDMFGSSTCLAAERTSEVSMHHDRVCLRDCRQEVESSTYFLSERLSETCMQLPQKLETRSYLTRSPANCTNIAQNPLCMNANQLQRSNSMSSLQVENFDHCSAIS